MQLTKLVLSDGSIINIAQPSHQSRRHTNNKSRGRYRTRNSRANALAAYNAVGGTSLTSEVGVVRAIGYAAGHHLCVAEEGPTTQHDIVTNDTTSTPRWTNDLGGSTPSPYLGGRG